MIPAARFKAGTSRFARQRMVKSGNSTSSSMTPAIVPNWVSDMTYPAVIASHSLIVVGSGAVVVTFHGVFSGTNQANNPQSWIYKNGVAVAPSAPLPFNGPLDCLWVGPVNDGDQLSVYDNGFSSVVTGTSSYLDVKPSEGLALIQQRLNKSSNITVTSVPVKISGWVPDATNPAATTADALVVVGTGTGTLTASITSGTGNSTLTMELRVSGVAVGTTTIDASETKTIVVPGLSLVNGDTVELWATTNSSTQRDIGAATYISITPS